MGIMTEQNVFSQARTAFAGSGSCVKRSFALTFPQLIAQAIDLGMDERGLGLLRCGHDLAERTVDGMYRPQGMPFINHLVRTASIVMAQGQPIDVIIAAMLHGVYMLDGFEDSRRRRIRPADRAFLQREVGQKAETLVWGYAHLGWHRRNVIEEHLAKLDSYDADTKAELVIKLANELEDHLDLAALFRIGFPYRKKIEEYGELCATMAVRLGLPGLAQALKEAYDATLSYSVPEVVIRDYRNVYERSRNHFWEMNWFEQLASKAKHRVRKAWKIVGRRVEI